MTPTKPKEVIISSNFLSLDEVSQVVHKLVNHSSIDGLSDNYYNFGDNDYFGFSGHYSDDIQSHFNYFLSSNLSPEELQVSLESKNVFTLIEKHNPVFVTEKKKYLYQIQEGEDLLTSPLFYLNVNKNEFYSGLNSWWDSLTITEKEKAYTTKIRGMVTTLRYHLQQLFFIKKEDFVVESCEFLSFFSRLVKFLLTTDDKLYYDKESDEARGTTVTAHYNNDVIELLGIFRYGTFINYDDCGDVVDKLNLFNNLFIEKLKKEIEGDQNVQLVLSLSKIWDIDSMFELYQELGKSPELRNTLSRKPTIVVNVKEAIDNITCGDYWLDAFEILIENLIEFNNYFNLVTTEKELNYITKELNEPDTKAIDFDELRGLQRLLELIRSYPLLKQ